MKTEDGHLKYLPANLLKLSNRKILASGML